MIRRALRHLTVEVGPVRATHGVIAHSLERIEQILGIVGIHIDVDHVVHEYSCGRISFLRVIRVDMRGRYRSEYTGADTVGVCRDRTGARCRRRRACTCRYAALRCSGVCDEAVVFVGKHYQRAMDAVFFRAAYLCAAGRTIVGRCRTRVSVGRKFHSHAKPCIAVGRHLGIAGIHARSVVAARSHHGSRAKTDKCVV